MKIYRISKNTVNINVAIQKAKDITPLLMQDIEELKKTKRIQKTRSITFIDPYTKQEKTITFKIKLKQIEALEAGTRGEEIIEIYVPIGIVDYSKDPNTGFVKIDPNTGSTYIKKQPIPFTEEDLYNVLIHEITHTIDPKTVKFPGEPFSSSDDGGAKAYYSNPQEIDAFHTEITQEISNAITSKKINKEMVMNWLRGSQINLQGILQSNALNALNYWYKNNPDIIKLLRQRIYTAIQNIPIAVPNSANPSSS